MDARQHRRQHQIGIGVGPGRAVLDAPGGAGTAGHAQGHGAVVVAPAGLLRHPARRRQAAEAVGVGRPDRHRLRHGRRQAADGPAQLPAAGLAAVVEDVGALRIQQRQVDVGAAGGKGAERAGHEGRRQPVAGGDPLHRPLQQQGVVAGGEDVGAVIEVDLELRRRVFHRRHLGGDVLLAAGGDDGLQHRCPGVELRHQIDLRRRRPLAAGGGAGGQGAPALLFHQVELQLEGHIRPQAQRLQPGGHGGEDVARVQPPGPAAAVAHGEQHLRPLRPRPGHRRQRSRHRVAGIVRIAVGGAHAGALDVVAQHVHGVGGPRQRHTLAVELVEGGDVEALAARHAADIRHHGVDPAHLRMARQEGRRFAGAGRRGGGAHGGGRRRPARGQRMARRRALTWRLPPIPAACFWAGRRP